MNLKILISCALMLIGCNISAIAQISTPNIDFETGTTTGWTFYRGTVASGPVWSLGTCAAVPTLHDITSSAYGTDYYGGFPALGGGAYSLRLGKDTLHFNSDAASYNIHIPATDKYRLQFRCAIVLNDGSHALPDQSRFDINITDSTTGTSLVCGNSAFIAGSLPGFSISLFGSSVYYKPWKTYNLTFTAAAGTTATLMFKVSDCGLGEHFGYAYVDVDSVTTDHLINPVYRPCHATADTFTAPFGYATYTWFDSLTFTHVFGTTQTCIIPAASVPTTYAVIAQNYIGLGCPDTLYTRVIPLIYLNKSNDTSICISASVSLTSGAIVVHSPLSYLWTPSAGLSCTTCDPVTATPTVTTTYTVTATDALSCSISDIIKVKVYTPPTMILGITGVCPGGTINLTDAVTGGTWSSNNTTIAIIGSTSGIVSGLSAGTAIITYANGPCYTMTTLTVNPSPGPISGSASVCFWGTSTLSDAGGGTWSSSNTAVATIGSTSGIVTAIFTGSSVITYTLSTGCSIKTTLTVNPIPTMSPSWSSTCGNNYTISSGASAGATTSWDPSTGLSCTICDPTTSNPPSTTTYTATVTNTFGCSVSDTISVNGNRIFGHITFSGPTPDTLDMKVWLIQFDPTDSSITALDSTTTCPIDSITYYEFDGKVTGNYMVKAKMIYGSYAGSSGYVPTYSLSTPNWYTAATTGHTGGSDSLHITMVYGTVPPGPGFISGYVYSGAGKGTSGDIPASGMLIFLENTGSHVMTHTYTDGAGAYSFNKLAKGDYVIYPEDYVYRTTPSATLTISDSRLSIHNVDFRQYTGSRKIIPYLYPNNIYNPSADPEFTVYPNPTDGKINIQWHNQLPGLLNISITDVIGREIHRAQFDINSSSGEKQIDLTTLKEGIYLIIIKSGDIIYSKKLTIQR